MNVYPVCAVDVFFGVSDPVYAGVAPYATIHVWIISPSQSRNVIKYSLVVSLYCAVYSTGHVTSSISGSHPMNVYPVCAVW